MRARGALLAVLLVLPGCGLTRVDAPISFRADHRLRLREPTAEAAVTFPVTVAWTASDFGAGVDGKHFAVFVDRVPLGPGKVLRRRVCSDKERRPVTLGEVRKPCRDDTDTVLETDATSVDLRCLQPKRDGPDRQRHRHTLAVVLMDGDGRRTGQAVSGIAFRVEPASGVANACRRGASG